MKGKFFQLVVAAALVGLFAACSDDDDALPTDDVQSQVSSLKLSFNFPPSLAGFDGKPHYALVTIRDENGNYAVENKKVPLSIEAGSFYTAPLDVQMGIYALTSFIVYDEDDNVVLATPLQASPKGREVGMGLPLEIGVVSKAPVVAITDVARVFSSDDAPVFGYTIDLFGGEDNDKLVTVEFRSDVSVGRFLYENLPSSVLITATDDEGRSWTVGRELDGSTAISIPSDYDSYYVKWAQWGDFYEAELSREQLFEQKAVKLFAEKEVKLLKSETSFIELEGGSRLDGHVDYFYNEDGKLSRRDFYHFNQETNEWVLQLVTWIDYANGLVHTIKRTSEGTLLDTQEYFYLPNGGIQKIVQTGLNGSQEAVWLYDAQTDKFTGVTYSFDSGTSFSYAYKFENGNIVHEYTLAGNMSGASSSQKQYDSFINPHYLLGITDYFLRNSSRNNVNAESHNYAGSFPVFVPGEYSYTYENGYPIEKTVKYVGYQNPSASYTSKTVYEYQ